MKKLLLIIPLLIWISCEDNDDSHPLDGLWEFKEQNQLEGWVDYTINNNRNWIRLTENTYESWNTTFNADSSLCYSYYGDNRDYAIEINEDGDNYILEISAILGGDPVSWTIECSLQDGVLYWRNEGDTVWQYKLEKISSFDFTPLCE